MFEDEPEQQATFNKPPEVIDVLVKALQASSRPVPAMFHANLFKSAEYWISIQEKPNKRTERVVPVKHNNKITGWLTPYHDRLVNRLKQFLSLSHIHQVYIIDAVHTGIPWRGENMEFYIVVCKEHRLMLEDKDKYIADAEQRRKQFKIGDAA